MTAASTSTLGKMVRNPVPSLALISWLAAIASAISTKDLGAVSSESRVCSEVGIELLKRGVSVSYVHDLEEATDHVSQGNAADAMVATTLCVGVTCTSKILPALGYRVKFVSNAAQWDWWGWIHACARSRWII